MKNKNNNKNYKIKKSNISGTGLFADKSFKKGQAVYSFRKGRVVTKSEIENLSRREREHLDKIGKDKYEIIEPPACYVNHSCSPNVRERNRKGYATRNIEKGEELTIDYDKVAHIEKPFRCKCGSVKCRKIIKGK